MPWRLKEKRRITMQICINGVNESVDTNHTIESLLKVKDTDPARVVVEVNENIIKRDKYPFFTINDGDRIEILRFVGGG
jgi:sulfur carrier protein